MATSPHGTIFQVRNTYTLVVTQHASPWLPCCVGRKLPHTNNIPQQQCLQRQLDLPGQNRGRMVATSPHWVGMIYTRHNAQASCTCHSNVGGCRRPPEVLQALLAGRRSTVMSLMMVLLLGSISTIAIAIAVCGSRQWAALQPTNSTEVHNILALCQQ